MALMNTHKSILGHKVDVICMQKLSRALNVVNFVSYKVEFFSPAVSHKTGLLSPLLMNIRAGNGGQSDGEESICITNILKCIMYYNFCFVII